MPGLCITAASSYRAPPAGEFHVLTFFGKFWSFKLSGTWEGLPLPTPPADNSTSKGGMRVVSFSALHTLARVLGDATCLIRTDSVINADQWFLPICVEPASL